MPPARPFVRRLASSPVALFAIVVGVPALLITALGIWVIRLDSQLSKRQQAERLDRAADAAVQALDQELRRWTRDADRLAEVPACTADALRAQIQSAARPSAIAFALCLEPGRAIVEPPGRLLYLPESARIDADAESPPPAILAAEAAELHHDDLSGSIEAYRRLLDPTRPGYSSALRPWALHRLARSLARAGRPDEALRVYTELEKHSGATMGALDAGLIAQSEACKLHETLGQMTVLDACARRFLDDLMTPRWTLEQARYGFYSSRVRTWLAKTSPGDVEIGRRLADEDRRRALSEAAAAAAEAASGLPADTPSLRLFAEQGALVFSRTSARARRTVVVGATLDACRTVVWPDVFASATADSLDVTLVAPGETVVFDTRPAVAARNSEDAPAPTTSPASGLRTVQAGEMTWRLTLAPRDAGQFDRDGTRRRWLYAATLAVMLGSVAFAGLLGARAVNEQVKVARLKSSFVATVSHEFRSPLTGICHLADLLARDRVPGEARRREYYGMILDEGRRLTRLVDHVLDFARMEEGRKQYAREPIDTGSWLAAAIAEFERSSSARGKRVDLSMAGTLPQIAGDAEALAGAVHNLLDNAAKYSPGCETIGVSASADQRGVRIEVSDRGVGIPADEQPRVFDRFFRGRELASTVKGTGLGLSLVKHVVEAHGGAIALDSAPGHGTRVTITLPEGS